MNVIIAYACFSSAYYCAFDFPRDNKIMFSLEHVVFITFMRLQEETADSQSSKPSHLRILKRYAKSGWLFLDLLATFPFYLIKIRVGDTPLGMWFKLVRLVRIPKLFTMFKPDKATEIIKHVLPGG